MSDSTALHLLQALGLSIIHSIWQAGAIALAAAAVLALSRRSAATVRYGIACAALGAMTLAPAVTFLSELSRLVTATPGSVAATAGTFDSLVLGLSATIPPDRAVAVDTPGWLPWIVGAWTLGFVVSSARLLAAWLGLRRLRRRARPRLTPAVAAALARVHVAMRFNPDSSLTVGESEDISTPTVIGWLRPVLLMPFGVVAGLAPAELEAILAHELAHIRRLDHVVNGFQIAAETVFFYHPAVWWISAEIRREREHCCDDVAVAVAGNRIVYATALAALEERRQHSLGLTLAATDGDLVSRVRRILGEPMHARRHALSLSWAGTLLGLTFVTAIITFAAPYRAQPRSETRQVTGQVLTDLPDLNLPRAQPAARQAPASTAETDRFVRNQVAILDGQFRTAVMGRDLTRLSALLADNFVSTNEDGIVDAKRSFLARVGGTSAYERSSQTVQLDGDLAIVTGAETLAHGTARERILVTRVWKRVQPTTWQLVSSTQFRDPRPQPAPGMASAPATRELDTAALRQRYENLQREYAEARARSLEAASTQPARTPTVGPDNTVRVGGDVREPKKIFTVAPIYPAIAKEANVSGVVILEALIDEEGSVRHIQVLRGHPMLDQAAIDAVQHWKYTPTTVNGAPVSLVMTITVNFSLPN
jgi:TonB family protein